MTTSCVCILLLTIYPALLQRHRCVIEACDTTCHTEQANKFRPMHIRQSAKAGEPESHTLDFDTILCEAAAWPQLDSTRRSAAASGMTAVLDCGYLLGTPRGHPCV